MRTPPPSASEPDAPAVVAADSHVPAVPEALSAAQPAPRQVSRPMRVAFLPLALATFVIIAFVMAAWTILAAA